MNKYSIIGLMIVLVWTIAFDSAAAHTHTIAQTAELVATSGISTDSLENKINEITNRSNLDDSLKKKLLNFYHTAEDNARTTEWFQAWTQSYQEAISKNPDQLKKLQVQIDKLQSQKTTEDFNKFSQEQLEQRLAVEKTHLNDLEIQINKLEDELAFHQQRPEKIRQESEAARQALDEIEKNSQVFNLLEETELEREARQTQQKTLENKLTGQLQMLNLEAISQPGRVDILNKKLQLALAQKQLLLPIIAEIENHLTQRQQLEAQTLKTKLLKAEQESLHKHPTIQILTKENINYSFELQTLAHKLEKNTQEKEQLEVQALEIDSDFKSAEKKISLAGLSPALGKILREQRYKLSNLDRFNLQSKYIQNETALTGLAEFKLETKLKQLQDIEAEIQRFLPRQTLADKSDEAAKAVESEVRSLLNEQKELLNKLSKAYSGYLRNLGDVDFARQQLLKQSDKYALYLDERLLWVPSSEPVDGTFFVNLYQSGLWLLTFSHWQTLVADIAHTFTRHYFLTLLWFVIVVSLLVYRPHISQQITLWTDKVSVLYNDHFRFTITALAYTILLVLPLPFSLIFIGTILESETALHDFSLAVAQGLQAAAVPLFFLHLFCYLFAPLGIVEKHFNWSTATTKLLHRQIIWVKQIAVPAIFLMTVANASKNTLHSDSLGRLALIVTMLVMIKALARVLHPKHGVLHPMIEQQPKSWLVRLRYLWYGSAIVIPLIIIGFALAGYYLSAVELQQKLIITLRFCFVLIIVQQGILRWLTLVDRRLALQNLQQQRRASLQNSSETDNLEPLLLDIPKINQQTRQLLNVTIGISLLAGVWMIWKNILPAFSFLDQIVLWQHLAVVDNQETFQAVTLTNLLLAGIALFVTLIAVNNIPGLLEVLVLSRFSFEIGSRYAITQLSRYLLIVLSVIFIANELGGSWSQVQWLVAALGVGLGFGLQEIFANFISGLILLFERPIRVGDTVTVGDVSGKVSQIQMRATRIMDWDQKELIVPNKTFITDKLINWTLSTQVTRVVIPLEIAYGSDVELAHQVISETVCNTPLVLTEPKPDVWFLGFGDSSLNFSIRVYVNELGHRLPVTHDLHVRLYKALAEHHIKIPFPQRDVHIRSSV